MSKLPEPRRRNIATEIRKDRERERRRSNSSPFYGTPIRPKADGSVQSDDFDGDLATDDAGTKGWALSSLKAAFGQLILRPGSIGNDSLTNPLEKDRRRASASNYSAPSGSWGTVCSVSATVPDGFTGVMAMVNGYNFVRNTNSTGGSNGTGGDLIYTQVGFGGLFTDIEGWPLSGSGGFTGSGVSDTFDIDGLSGGDVLTLQLFVSAGYQTIPADTSTRGFVSAGLFWFR